MRRRAKPTKATVEVKRAITRKSLKSNVWRVRDLEKRLAESLEREKATGGLLQTRNRELAEAQEQQTATGEILRTISSSPTDLQPVFDAIAAHALDLFRAKTGAVFRYDGERLHVAAAQSFSQKALESLRRTYPMSLSRGGASARAVLGRAIIYIPNIRKDEGLPRARGEDRRADHGPVPAQALRAPRRRGDHP
jgi:hypothetical protein